MPRSIIETMVLSLSPLEWLPFLALERTIIPIGDPSPELISYKGAMAFHSTAFLDASNAEQVKVMKDHKKAVELSGLEIPGTSMIGYGIVKKVAPLDEMNWNILRAAHGEEGTLAEWKWLFYNDINIPVYGIEFSETWLADPPVLGVLQPSHANDRQLWYPENPLQMEAMKLVLKAAKETA